MVLSIRHRTSKEDILSFNGEKLFIYAIEQGMVGKSSIGNNAIGETIITDNFAKGTFLFQGQKTPYFFHFYKEDGQWKIDLTALFDISAGAFEQMIASSGKDENNYLLELLEILTGNKPDNTIWRPLSN